MSKSINTLVGAGGLAADVVVNASIAAGGVRPSKFQGYKAQGVATLVGGTVNVVPGPAVVATDRVLILDSTPGAGAQGGLFLAALVAGGAGVGNFTITSTNVADTSTVVWVLVDNTFAT